MSGADPTEDGMGGDEEEYIMLRLRLTDGVVYDEFRNRYGMELPNTVVKRAKNLLRSGLLECDEKGIRLTKEGFIVSNAVISELLK
jgi:oxygen-independent coproporphyrinogen-3 oxidase